jgi:hemoglobin
MVRRCALWTPAARCGAFEETCACANSLSIRRSTAQPGSDPAASPREEADELGAYEHMLASDLGITDEQRFRFASLMSLAAGDTGLPDDPEFRSALVAYLEWGTRLALHNSQPGAAAAPHAPVPRWGWGEAPPYVP